MLTDSARLFRRLLALAAMLAVAACGSLEYPPKDGAAGRYDPSSDAFINATAVTVGKGDTVYSIARRHKLSPRDIIEANDLRPPYELSIGQRLVLPRGIIHTVRSGEYLALIAKKYGSDAYAIARINGIAAPYTIYPGQKLRIPRGTTTQVARAPTGGADTPRTATATRPQAPNRTAVPEPPARDGGKFAWPVEGKVISTYGPKEKGLHNDGINIAAERGTPVKAAENGVVAYAGNEIRGFGNLLLIKHDDGWVTAYAHNDQLLVKRGEKVARGQTISRVGSTGSVTTPQLHFELRRGSNAVDPRKYLM